MKLNIIYRVCDGVEVCSAHKRCFDVGKRQLVRKCFDRLSANIDAFIKQAGSENLRFVCVYDHCSDDTLAYIRSKSPYVEFVKPGVPGNAGSFCRCVEIASGLPDGEIAYFLEDDYLFLQNDVLLKLVYNMRRLSQYEGRLAAIMPDDYPDRYRDNTYRGTVRVTETGHFIKIDSTTCTFAVFTDSVKRNKEHLMRFAAWPRLGEAESVNMLWQPRGEVPLYSPVPAWTAHA